MNPTAEHVLLMPEDVAQTPQLTTPRYGAVITATGPIATVGLLSAPHSTVRVRTSIIPTRRVDPSEHGEGAPGEWMRRAVCGISSGTHALGQVIAYDADWVTIHTTLGDRTSAVTDLHEVSPVLCFLRGKSNIQSSDVSAEQLTEQNAAILDRILGAGRRGSRSIQRILAGFTPVWLQPKPGDTLRWIDINSGAESTVSVRHAIDFAYYVDGGHRVTPSDCDTIDVRFDDDPRYAAEERTSSVNDDAEDTRDELEALLNSLGPNEDMNGPPSHFRRVIPPQPQVRTETAIEESKHVKICAAIADDPDLIRCYLSLYQKASEKRPAPPADSREPQRRRLESPSDLIETTESLERRSKHAFNPTRTQQQVNGLITVNEYAGKDASIIVDAMISSRSSKFKPHPAIVIRVYDFQFGVSGLSIMHFWWFDFAARREWYSDGSVNLNNFSASVSLPKAKKPQSLNDVSNALTVLHVFAEKFFDCITCRLISNAREFVEELRNFCQWSPQDVGTLTFWFDRLFEEYRTETVLDARHGTTSRT